MCFAIPALGDKTFQHFTFMINGTPQLVGFTVDFYENFVQMPLPIRVSSHPAHPITTDFAGKHRAKSIPPNLKPSHGLYRCPARAANPPHSGATERSAVPR